MEDIIGKAWASLYAFNPKIQAFAVLKDGRVIWQTSNWDLVPFTAELVSAYKSSADNLRIANVDYHRIYSDEFCFIASSEGQGHLLLSAINDVSWVVAWVSHDASPELAEIDLAKTALDLMAQM